MQVGKQTPETRRLWEDSARKSVRRKTTLRNQVLSTAHEVSVLGDGGTHTKQLAIEIPANTVESVFGRTTRGLYFHHTGSILDPNCRLTVDPLLPHPIDPLLDQFQRNEIGGTACIYWYEIDAHDRNASLWLYHFYSTVWIQVLTGAYCEDAA